jgi:hypothetical protein
MEEVQLIKDFVYQLPLDPEARFKLPWF